MVACPLECEANCELQLPCEVRLAVDLSELAARQIRVRRIEIRRVEAVERLRPELRLHPLFESEVFEDGEIPVLLPWAAQATQSPGRAAERGRGGGGECGGVDVVVQAPLNA